MSVLSLSPSVQVQAYECGRGWSESKEEFRGRASWNPTRSSRQFIQPIDVAVLQILPSLYMQTIHEYW
jgi:hypothetical protein